MIIVLIVLFGACIGVTVWGVLSPNSRINRGDFIWVDYGEGYYESDPDTIIYIQ